MENSDGSCTLDNIVSFTWNEVVSDIVERERTEGSGNTREKMRHAATAVLLRDTHYEEAVGKHRYNNHVDASRNGGLGVELGTNPITSSLSHIMRFGRDQLDFLCDMSVGDDDAFCLIPQWRDVDFDSQGPITRYHESDAMRRGDDIHSSPGAYEVQFRGRLAKNNMTRRMGRETASYEVRDALPEAEVA